jgi:hypothetical protein
MSSEHVEQFTTSLGGDATVHETTAEDAPATIEEAITEPAIGTPLPIDGVSLSDTPVETEFSPADLETAATGVTAARIGISDYGTVTLPSDAAGTELASLYCRRHVAVDRTTGLVRSGGRQAADAAPAHLPCPAALPEPRAQGFEDAGRGQNVLGLQQPGDPGDARCQRPEHEGAMGDGLVPRHRGFSLQGRGFSGGRFVAHGGRKRIEGSGSRRERGRAASLAPALSRARAPVSTVSQASRKRRHLLLTARVLRGNGKSLFNGFQGR